MGDVTINVPADFTNNPDFIDRIAALINTLTGRNVKTVIGPT
jgi:hypothetical protein